jgi:TPP-dependent pyruvate/acetoin dehydrogenase alpha subunit
MNSNLTPADLIAFEEDIASCFNAKMIKAPVHLYSGNEEQMIDIFKDVRDEDWVMCTWRSHYQCLLKGVPPEELKQAILDGKSITLSFEKYKVLSSAIVAGILPIAVGTAMGLKLSGKPGMVHVFIGDMTAETGTFHETYKYAHGHDLPIRFIVEDNSISVCTPTQKVWNPEGRLITDSRMVRYEYKSKYPHAGAGARIQF